jgi:hypothetical protein
MSKRRHGHNLSSWFRVHRARRIPRSLKLSQLSPMLPRLATTPNWTFPQTEIPLMNPISTIVIQNIELIMLPRRPGVSSLLKDPIFFLHTRTQSTWTNHYQPKTRKASWCRSLMRWLKLYQAIRPINSRLQYRSISRSCTWERKRRMIIRKTWSNTWTRITSRKYLHLRRKGMVNGAENHLKMRTDRRRQSLTYHWWIWPVKYQDMSKAWKRVKDKVCRKLNRVLAR